MQTPQRPEPPRTRSTTKALGLTHFLRVPSWPWWLMVSETDPLPVSTGARGQAPLPLYSKVMLRVRFAPSPTGFLHVGSARTFIFNWLYARRNGGTMVLRLDDTDVERNTEASVNSIFEGLRWLNLGWDEEYKQSERLALHRQIANAIFQKGLAYRDFTPAHTSAVQINDGEKFKSADDIEDFALLRSDGMPTYHLASCADDIDLRISHIIRGQDHLSNTYKHLLIFEGAGAKPPQFAHLPLLVAPDGSKLSKRRHGPVVSVTTYRDSGFLPEAFINFLCLLGWSPKDNRENMTRQE